MKFIILSFDSLPLEIQLKNYKKA